tara:strand:- start:1533 stop:1787 length:255 start_codon:yes stop_codon:yes gene_type:complete
MAPEANPFPGEGDPILDKIRQEFPEALGYPQSTFRIVTDDCPEGSIKIMGMQTLLGPDTVYLTCDQVDMLIDLAGSIVPGAELG